MHFIESIIESIGESIVITSHILIHDDMRYQMKFRRAIDSILEVMNECDTKKQIGLF